MADDKQPAKEEKPASAPQTTQPAPAEPASASIISLLLKGFLDWFNTKKAKAAIVGFILITVGMAGLFQYQHDSIKAMSLADAIASGGGGGGGSTGKDPFAKWKDAEGQAPLTGQSQEGAAENTQKIPIADKNVHQLVAVLTWTDEANTARHTNQPDTFQIKVTAPDGRTSQGSNPNELGKQGVIEVVLSRDVSKEAMNNKALKQKTADTTWTGDWNITIACTSAGDQTPNIGPGILPFRTTADTGNAWSLAINWTYKAEP